MADSIRSRASAISRPRVAPQDRWSPEQAPERQDRPRRQNSRVQFEYDDVRLKETADTPTLPEKTAASEVHVTYQDESGIRVHESDGRLEPVLAGQDQESFPVSRAESGDNARSIVGDSRLE